MYVSSYIHVAILIFVGYSQIDTVGGDWHYCLTCSHSKDYPSQACINATDTRIVNCSDGFCYTNIQYDKNDMSIVSMLRRCLNKFMPSLCITDPSHVVCEGTCEEDYCAMEKKNEGDGSSNGISTRNSNIFIFICILFSII